MSGDRTSNRPGLFALTVTAVVVLLATACGGSSNTSDGATDDTAAPSADLLASEGEPVAGGKVVVGVTAETNGWNPALAQWADAGQFVGSSFLEPLFVYDAEANLVPWLAISATPDDPEDRSWTIKVRQGVMFHDGTEMNAQAVADSYLLAVREGLAKVALDELVESVTVLDTYTFQVKLKVRWTTFPFSLAGNAGFVMAPSMLAKEDKGKTSPVGTGAFEFRDWNPDKALNVRKFDDYWGGPCAAPDPDDAVITFCEDIDIPLGQRLGPWLDGMEFRPIADGQQRANALRAGDLNMMLTTRAEDTAAMREDFEVVTDYNSEKTLVMTNTTAPPFTNQHARLALAYATDRQALVDRFSGGEVVVSDTSPMSEASKWGSVAPDETGYPAFDREKARQEIEAYKADTGEPSLSFTLQGLANTEELQIMQDLQAQWAEAGIEVQVESLEQTAYILKVTQADFQAAYFRNYSYRDPDSNYVFWSASTTTGAIRLNFSGYTSEDTENAVRLGRTSKDFPVRYEAYQQLSEERNEQAVDIWLFDTPYALVAESRIQGLNAFRGIPFGNILPKPYLGALWVDPER